MVYASAADDLVAAASENSAQAQDQYTGSASSLSPLTEKHQEKRYVGGYSGGVGGYGGYGGYGTGLDSTTLGYGGVGGYTGGVGAYTGGVGAYTGGIGGNAGYAGYGGYSGHNQYNRLGVGK